MKKILLLSFVTSLFQLANAQTNHIQITGTTSYHLGDIYHMGGKVGIGTLTPHFPLQIYDEHPVHGGQIGETESYLQITNQNTGNSITDGLLLGSKSNAGYLMVQENSNLHLGTNGIPRLSLTFDGNTEVMGNIIGKTSSGILTIYSKINATQGGYMQMYGNSTSQPGTISLVAGDIGYVPDAGCIDVYPKQTGKFRVRQDGDWFALDIDNAGNFYMDFNSPSVNTVQRLHIGTRDHTNPEHMLDAVIIGNYDAAQNGMKTDLHVHGEIKSCFVETQEVLVQDNGWCDYVFEKDYDLKPLEEVKIFIENNGHLPNIPSADEVASGGRGLADMQKRMMEKIEELTLYIIQQQEEIQQLREENQQISATINALNR